MSKQILHGEILWASRIFIYIFVCLSSYEVKIISRT